MERCIFESISSTGCAIQVSGVRTNPTLSYCKIQNCQNDGLMITDDAEGNFLHCEIKVKYAIHVVTVIIKCCRTMQVRVLQFAEWRGQSFDTVPSLMAAMSASSYSKRATDILSTVTFMKINWPGLKLKTEQIQRSSTVLFEMVPLGASLSIQTVRFTLQITVTNRSPFSQAKGFL